MTLRPAVRQALKLNMRVSPELDLISARKYSASRSLVSALPKLNPHDDWELKCLIIVAVSVYCVEFLSLADSSDHREQRIH